SGIAAAFILCVIFFAKIAEQPKPKLVEGDKSQATEVVQDGETKEEAVLVEEEVEFVLADTPEGQIEQVRQMVRTGDAAGLHQILESGLPESQLAAAYYLGKISDADATAQLEDLVRPLVTEPNGITGIEGQKSAQSKIDGLKSSFKAKGLLSGLVLDAGTGEAIEGAEVQIVKGRIYTARTDASGYYFFNEIEEEGNYQIGVWSDAYLGIYERDEMPSLNLGAQTQNVQHFELKPACMLQVQVVNEIGEPIEGVSVVATSFTSDRIWEEIGQEVYSKRTDVNGMQFLGGFEPSEAPYLITAFYIDEGSGEGDVNERPELLTDYAPGKLSVVLTDPNILVTGEIVLQKGMRIKGYAEYLDGAAAGGLKVISQPDWWHISYTGPMAEIEPNGFFTLDHIVEGKYNISIFFPSADGGGRYYPLFQSPLPIEEGLLTIRVPEKSPESLASISGTISYLDGPLPSYVDVSAGSREHGSKHVTITENVEEFTIKGLEPGIYTLSFSGVNIEEQAVLNVSAPSEGLNVELRYVTKPIIRGIAVSAENNILLEDFKVRLRKLRMLRRSAYTQTDRWVEFRNAGGQFEIETVGPGIYQVQIDAEGLAPAWSEEIDTDLNAPVVIVLSAGGSIRGRVLNESGEPVSGAKVIPLSKASGTMPRVIDTFVTENGSVETVKGEFILEHLPEGVETLKVKHPDYSFAIVEEIAISEGQITKGIDIILTKGGTVEGYVYDFDNQPQANITLYFQDKSNYSGGQDEAAGRLATAITDMNGHYLVEGLPEQMCYIRRSDLRESFGVVSRCVIPSNGKVSRIDFGGGPVVTGQFIIGGAPLSNSKVLLGCSSVPYLGGFICYANTDQAGQFSLSGVPPGQYSLYYKNPEKRSDWRKVSTFDIFTEDIDLGVVPELPSSMSVYISNESNEPNLSVLRVSVQEGAEFYGLMAGLASKPISENAPYVFSEIIPGRYTAVVTRADML
ncbi:MAG: carboxypeptidase regulatory-like domain-containing protein, partial [Planctomycetota bacterium]